LARYSLMKGKTPGYGSKCTDRVACWKSHQLCGFGKGIRSCQCMMACAGGARRELTVIQREGDGSPRRVLGTTWTQEVETSKVPVQTLFNFEAKKQKPGGGHEGGTKISQNFYAGKKNPRWGKKNKKKLGRHGKGTSNSEKRGDQPYHL